MLPTFTLLRKRLAAMIDDQEGQGHVVEGLQEELGRLHDSYDAFAVFAERNVGDIPKKSP